MSIIYMALEIFAIVLAAAAIALAVLAIQERIRLKQNPPRHLKPEPTTPTVKEVIKND